MTDEPAVLRLSHAQLAAYNAADVDAFCACYHPDVRVLDADGRATLEGLAAFRERYATMFRENREVHAVVHGRLLLPPHVVEAEAWSRVNVATGEASAGEVLVRYTERDGRIAVVEFLR